MSDKNKKPVPSRPVLPPKPQRKNFSDRPPRKDPLKEAKPVKKKAD